MSAQVIPMLRSEPDAWRHYCDLVAEQKSNPALLTNIEHQLKIVRAWKRWRDTVLALDLIP